MTTTTKKALAGVTTATLLLAPALAAPSFGASTPHLTKATAATLASRDAQAAAVITQGDKVNVRGCRALAGGAFTCQIELVPVHSSSRCHWTDTIRLVRGKPRISYSHARCAG